MMLRNLALDGAIASKRDGYDTVVVNAIAEPYVPSARAYTPPAPAPEAPSTGLAGSNWSQTYGWGDAVGDWFESETVGGTDYVIAPPGSQYSGSNASNGVPVDNPPTPHWWTIPGMQV